MQNQKNSSIADSDKSLSLIHIYATVFAQAFSVLLSVLIIRKKTLPFEFSRKSIRFDKRIIGRIVVLGLPIALQDLLVSVSFLVIIAIVNSLGVVASAGIGVAEKLCAFIMLVRCV